MSAAEDLDALATANRDDAARQEVREARRLAVKEAATRS